MFEKFLCLMSVIAAVSVEVFAASECEVNGLCAFREEVLLR